MSLELCRVRFLVFLVAWLGALPASAADVAGSADLTGIGRFEGSEIESYRVENYGSTTFATGPVGRGVDVEATSRTIEGALTRIVYRVPPGSSPLEIFRNFEARMRDVGYRLLFSGGPDDIDGYTFAYQHPVEILDEAALGNGIWYAFGSRQQDGAESFLSVLVSPHSGGDGVRVRLIEARTKQMEQRMVDAAEMRRSIAETGRVALYGIYFDTDSAVVKPESEPTLSEIAALLASQPDVKLIVVGHTDDQGSYEHNLDLSRRRAEAVRAQLVEAHGVGAPRLRSAGVGYLAPAASNDDATGRQLNRRVELVQER